MWQRKILMKKFGTNQSVKRVEDQSLLRGEGRFVSDICPKNAVYVHFYRSPVAHAKIENLNVDKAAKSKGVLAVFTAHDLKGKLLNSMNFDLVKNKNVALNHNILQNKLLFLSDSATLCCRSNLKLPRGGDL